MSLNQLQKERAIAKAIVEITRMHSFIMQKVSRIEQLADTTNKQLLEIKRLPKGEKGDRGERGVAGVGIKGKDGKTPKKGEDYWTPEDVAELTRTVISKIRMPKDGKDAVIDEKKIAKMVLDLILEKKLITKDHVAGLNEEIGSYRHQMAMRQAGQHGGGDTVEAGSGITITNDPTTGRKTISTTGGGVTVETPVGAVDASNTTYTVTAQPQWVVADGVTYYEGAGYSYVALTITMDVPPSQYIRAII